MQPHNGNLKQHHHKQGTTFVEYLPPLNFPATSTKFLYIMSHQTGDFLYHLSIYIPLFGLARIPLLTVLLMSNNADLGFLAIRIGIHRTSVTLLHHRIPSETNGIFQTIFL